MTLYALGDLRPDIHEDTWVAPCAKLIGQVVVEAAASVWFGVTIRADHEVIRVGKGSNVQEDVVMHIDKGFPLTIGENCTIGHQAMLHGCTIGDNTLIGMGATVLNGAKIGKNCLIGAGALITEGKEIPDNSLVMGAPGKIIRAVDAAGAQRLTASALHYQENMRRFKADLKEI
ncbi:2,3,4,5-tetrahydropyridine-2,6-dicarboxylate N-acetyltransferase [Tritonibacter multivorans]|uniref:2,3,4,5-tetrahydropyridine-2,6-dicarboxylate N-acetyltransferase n=1 Tax=Tritonibacter multivorans TaxID=928856 RepID=A0A0P1GK04_9RHOB|nr:gamma carbonic anhydrase family protein [Tritonibacter multivorans]MDA7421473.1 gamma carbonic anhydrase family protein [Tritonibacter multivorans]CUH82333.1 2,3,4,5-tetrahydropyridine-2,6-dicarboxylate N-acetyltransferase [Tritonibacter multivorans]SFC98764.1 Carbonic anhydrase or acetyltransferase, isoleucine patch superfamily [Tritonibacter multivorans]